MESVGDVIKRNEDIILETNDPVVTEGFTQVPNFILKNSNLLLRVAQRKSLSWSGETCKRYWSHPTKCEYVYSGVEKKRIPHD